MNERIRINKRDIKIREEWTRDPSTKVLKSEKDYDRHSEKQEIERNLKDSQDLEDLRIWFREKAKTVDKEMAVSSNCTDAYSIPEFLDVIEIGEEIIPVILEYIEDKHPCWLLALNDITHIHPDDKYRGNIRQTIEWWKKWYKNQNQ